MIREREGPAKGSLKYNTKGALIAMGCNPYCPFGKAFVWDETLKAYCCSYVALTGTCCCCVKEIEEM